MKNRCHLFLSVWLGIVLLGTSIRVVQNRDFSASELQEDFQQMRQTIEKSHPALYEFTDIASFDRLYKQQYAKISQKLSLEEFYRLIVPIVNKVGCGHSNLWMPEGWLSQPSAKYFPLKLAFINNKAYVVEKNGAIPLGSQILSINGTPTSVIMQQILAAISSDGFNSSYRMKRMENMFPFQFAKQFGFADEFIVGYIPFNQKEVSETTISYSDFGQTRPKIVGKRILKKDIISETNTGILKINDFVYYKEHHKFFEFIDNAFKEFADAEVTSLILDLRDNDGGDPFCAAHLFSYLASAPVPYFSQPYGKYAKLAEPLPLAKNRFSGKLYILINGMCFSTTGHLTSLLKYHKIGTFIGTETGGTYTCNDATKENVLKNTKIQLWIARRSFATAVEGLPKDRGIVPDIRIEPKIEDLILGKDTVLDYVLDLIRNH